MRRIAIAVLTAFVSVSASAADWVEIASNKAERISVDRATLARDDNLVSVWLKQDVLIPTEANKLRGKTVRQIVTRWSFLCGKRTMVQGQAVIYDQNLAIIETVEAGPPKFTDVVPNTMAEHVMTIVCD